MVPMTEERDAADLSTAVSEARRRIDSLTLRTTENLGHLLPALTPSHSPRHADGAAVPPAPLDVDTLQRDTLHAVDGLTGDRAEFTTEHTTLLADIGRELRKFGVTVEHYAAVAEAAGRAVCGEFGHPYPGADLTYRQSAELGIPDGVTELLHAVDNAIRIVALGAVEDDDAGIPASLAAEVLEVEQRTASVTVVRLQAQTLTPGWAGQALEVRTPSTPDVWHQFASALPPNEHGYLEFHCPSSVTGTAQTPQVGETWVVANPTGGLGVPRDWSGEVVMLALGGGLAALRALVLEMSGRPDRPGHPGPSGRPDVHLYWGVTDSTELHELDGLNGLASGFPWFTFTPVVLDEDHDTAAGAAVSDGRIRPGVLTLVSGEDAATVAEQVRLLTDAGADRSDIIAEP